MSYNGEDELYGEIVGIEAAVRSGLMRLTISYDPDVGTNVSMRWTRKGRSSERWVCKV